MSVLTAQEVIAAGVTDLIVATSPIHDGRPMLTQRFSSKSKAIEFLRACPRPLYVMQPHPEKIKEWASQPDLFIRYSCGSFTPNAPPMQA